MSRRLPMMPLGVAGFLRARRHALAHFEVTLIRIAPLSAMTESVLARQCAGVPRQRNADVVSSILVGVDRCAKGMLRQRARARNLPVRVAADVVDLVTRRLE